jgi:hypothetical protein
MDEAVEQFQFIEILNHLIWNVRLRIIFKLAENRLDQKVNQLVLTVAKRKFETGEQRYQLTDQLKLREQNALSLSPQMNDRALRPYFGYYNLLDVLIVEVERELDQTSEDLLGHALRQLDVFDHQQIVDGTKVLEVLSVNMDDLFLLCPRLLFHGQECILKIHTLRASVDLALHGQPNV